MGLVVGILVGLGIGIFGTLAYFVYQGYKHNPF